MGKLTGNAIECAIENGQLEIEDFSKEHLNPNSYNLTLAPRLLVYKPRRWWTPWRKPLVWGEKNPPDAAVMIPGSGYVIRPGWFYLGSTLEYTKTKEFVPQLDGRSTSGRVSLHIHATAGLGDIGFEGCWTMEIYSIVPVRIFPYIRIAQISYDKPHGRIREVYRGRYSGFRDAIPACEDNGKTFVVGEE